MDDVKKILIVRFSSFGDIVLTFPLINLIKKKFPGSQITFLAKSKYRSLLEINQKIDEIITLPQDSPLATFRGELKRNSYDIVLDLQNNVKSRIVTSGLNNLSRFKKHNFEKYLLVRFKINLLKETPPVYKRYIETLGSFVTLSKIDKEFSNSALTQIAFDTPVNNYFILAPSSRHFTKTYPKEKFVEYVNLNPDKNFILVGDNSDTDHFICNYITDQSDNVFNLCGVLTYPELVYLINESNGVISNDSGMMHFAEAAGKPVTAIFGSTVKEFGFFPQLHNSNVIENSELSCRPCSHIGLNKCPKGHFKCMLDLNINKL